MIEFNYCDKCDKGWIYNAESDSVTKCNCLKEYQDRVRLEKSLQDSNIPSIALDYKVLSLNIT